jgi:Ca-activated chloride channel family protein
MHRLLRVGVGSLLIVLLVAACSGAGPSAAPSSAPPSVASSAAPSSPTERPTGPASVSGPATIAAGTDVEVSWTGPNADGDYVTIVKAGTTAWTSESYIDTSAGASGLLVGPLEPGDYELWYVNGADNVPSARQDITVTAFVGSLDAPDEVDGGATFEVSWTGPNARGDYITIVQAGKATWTNEGYFNTAAGPTGELTAPLEAGAYEIWYVPGQSREPEVRLPITVKAVAVTLDAPETVEAGSTFEVAWTGPDGPGDYITIVPIGSPVGTYLSYANTNSGSPVTLTAPAEPGDYEIWYAADRVDLTLAIRSIRVE